METGPAPAPPPTAPEPEPELLQAGPGIEGRDRRVLPIVLTVVALGVAGLLAFQFWPRPVPPLTLPELQGIYAGMVRGDGTNDASVLQRPTDAPVRPVDPAECLPLFDTTAFDRFPDTATDGVGTYWMAERVGTSLFTFRFADAAAAEQVYGRVDTALATCTGQEIRLAQRRTRAVVIEKTPVSMANGVRDQLGYQYAPAPSTRFAVHVLRYENLLTWQFRYDTADGDYSPVAAQQIMDSLVAQMKSIVDLRP